GGSAGLEGRREGGVERGLARGGEDRRGAAVVAHRPRGPVRAVPDRQARSVGARGRRGGRRAAWAGGGRRHGAPPTAPRSSGRRGAGAGAVRGGRGRDRPYAREAPPSGDARLHALVGVAGGYVRVARAWL